MIAFSLMPQSVLKKYSSRCVPSRSWTKTHCTITSPCPALYQCPVPVTASTFLCPPPYQSTTSRVLSLAFCTTCSGVSVLSPFCRGLPPLRLLPFFVNSTSGGGRYSAAFL